MRYVSGIDEQGRPIDVRDPLAARLRQISEASKGEAAELAAGLLRVTEIFGDDLSANAAFRDTVTRHLTRLYEVGARETVRQLTQP
jgi:fructuronate reductase